MASSALYRSASSPVRTWRTTSALVPTPAPQDPNDGAPKSSYNGVLWLNIPRPLRDAATWGIDGLAHNRYGVPPTAVSTATPTGDIGDLADLDANERMVSDRVLSLAIGWTDAGGSAFAVASGAPADERRNGLYMDVVGPENGLYPSASVVPPDPAQGRYDYKPDLAGRPRIVRVALGMRDAGTGVAQDFAFSIATAGMPPPVTEPAP